MTDTTNPLTSQICTGCGKNGMECKCPEFHPNKQKELTLNETEARALYRVLEHEFIPYEDEEVHQAVNKLSEFVNELAR